MPVLPLKNPPAKKPIASMRLLAALAFFVVLPAFQSAYAAAPDIINDRFVGVDTTLPGGRIKKYPDPKVWAFTFWPGTKWPDSYGDGTNWLAANGECQTYVTPFLESVAHNPVPASLRYDPFSIQPDGLHIKAALLTPEQQAAYRVGGFRRFGSGMLLSRSSFTYAKIRMVAKLPSARGSWPALWLLPESHQWPPEIDIFEGMPWGQHSEQIHTALLTPKGEPGGHFEWTELHTDPSKDFHEYGIDWTADTITMLFDGKPMWQEHTPPSMHQAMYLIVNFAVGGKWPFNELHVLPVDSMNPDRLAAGADLIQSDYPAEMIVKSITVTAL